MLDPKFKENWIAALLSGKYEQGKACLRTADNKFCCLGVACDVIDSSSWVKGDRRYEHNGNSGYIPEELGEKVGLSLDIQFMIAPLNDTKGYSFEDIAKWIKENL